VKAKVESLLDNFRFRDAQKEAMNLARIGNKYLADSEPWKVIKTDPERVKTIINLSLQLTANLAIAFEPFLPFSSKKLREMLNEESFEWSRLGSIDLLPAGHQLAKPELLFEKIEDETIQKQMDRLARIKKENEAANFKAEPVKKEVTYDDFEKLDIRVGTVLSCEKVKKSNKLLKFEIADGLTVPEGSSEGRRTILSGIAQYYNPEDLVGKQVCFIANFPPRKMMGHESQGMILSAVNYDGSLSVITPQREVKPGSQVG
jgi:methionyl-tRNA synthetase